MQKKQNMHGLPQTKSMGDKKNKNKIGGEKNVPVIKVKHIEPKPISTFTNHALVSGKSGSGKSNTCEYIITQKIGREKVIDL